MIARILAAFTIFLFCHPASAFPSIAFFYGKHVPVPDICLYDSFVIDPSSDFNPQNNCGPQTEPFAYVSMGEVAKDAPYAKDIKPNWIIGKNVAWNNNYVIDQTNPEWQSYFINQLITPLWEKGYRGFFFDTLDSYILAVHDPALQQKQLDSMVNLIHQIKVKYPQAKIILNRGFKLLPTVRSDVYADVIESLYHAWNQQNLKYEDTALATQKELLTEINLIKQMNLPIIIIDYLPPDQQQKAAILARDIAQQGMIPWITNNNLDTLYINKMNGANNQLREILIVVNTVNKFPTQYTPSFSFLGVILEYLGYIPRYYNLTDKKLLPTGDMRQYAGIILWLDDVNAKNIPVILWAKLQITNHIPVVFMNTFGVPVESKELNLLGLTVSSINNLTKSLQIVKMDPQYVGFEMKPPTTPYDFFPLRAANSEVLLQFKNEYQQTEDTVAITPWGGYAVIPGVLFYLPNNYPFWVLNPINFIQRALRLESFPIPVATTENGRRLMTVHIDGDGFSYPANWIGGTFAGHELLEKVLKEYHIPTSVSVITGEIAPDGIHPDKSKIFMQTARDIFALPWVEIASHTFSHPFYWQKNTFKNFADLFGNEPFYIKIPGYTFNLQSEITGSVDFINKNLAPADKKCHLFFWSGMADPSAAALKMTYDDNLLNINGQNDTAIDNQYPSITGIRPMAFPIEGYYQVYAPIDMDYYYMNGFAALYGYETVIETLKRTDEPRRFKPIDLYYHVYSAGFPASLQALYKVYDWALAQPVMNVFISDYIKKVLDFYQIKISKNNSSWYIYTNGEIRELRLDKKMGYPDLINSQNVIGFSENKDNLYIHLGPDRFTILNFQKTLPATHWLTDANARVINYSRDKNETIITFQGYMPLRFTLANVGTCKVNAKNPLKTTANQNNTISYEANESANEIHISC